MKNELSIKYLNINELRPYENNPRNNKKAVDYVANSIAKFGFKQPIVVDKNKIIVCGHTRLEAAKKLGVELVPCILADDLSEEEIKAYRLADNKVAEFSDWDDELLQCELGDLPGLDMSEFGFDLNIEQLPEVTEDDFDTTPPEEPKAKIGDIYKLGQHRLMCGDSTFINNFDALMGGGACRFSIH